MQGLNGSEKRGAKAQKEANSAGGMLRQHILDKIQPILHESNAIENSNSRLLIQACCLDVVTSLEDLIEDYKLDECTR